MDQSRVDEALETLGAVLTEQGTPASLLVIGGSSLLLLGLGVRPTYDVDVVAIGEPGRFLKAAPLPSFIAEAVVEVGRSLGLGETFPNTGPAAMVDLGLPPGLDERVTLRRYGVLEIHLPGREDLICFKVYAEADLGPGSKHLGDLEALAPTPAELAAAARWCRTHDDSAAFRGLLRAVLGHFGVEADDGGR
jgi:hypothetical protein